MRVDQTLEQGFIRVTEQAAIAAARTMGHGDKHWSDKMAVESMRKEIDAMDASVRIVIGEGERDKAPMLFIGEELGQRKGEDDEDAGVDIAVDPLEGTNLCAYGINGAVAVLAAAERGGLLHAPDTYMDKIVVGPTARGVIHIDAPVAENLRNIAKAFRRQVDELVVVVLDRERHEQLIQDIRSAGARIRLIRDGDLSAGVAAAIRGTGVHAVMGIGGAPEGVITAAAMKCMGGEIQARLTAIGDDQVERLRNLGYEDLDKVYSTDDLAPGEQILFSCTGVTDGELLSGVRLFGGSVRTSTLYMSHTRRILRFVDTIHRQRLDSPVQI